MGIFLLRLICEPFAISLLSGYTRFSPLTPSSSPLVGQARDLAPTLTGVGDLVLIRPRVEKSREELLSPLVSNRIHRLEFVSPLRCTERSRGSRHQNPRQTLRDNRGDRRRRRRSGYRNGCPTSTSRHRSGKRSDRTRCEKEAFVENRALNERHIEESLL